MFTILGAGLAGLSVADHLSKNGVPYKIFEAKRHGGGHIHSEEVDGFTWDEGPHVSFTKYEYVKKYFAQNCGENFLEYPTKPTNYYKSHWIMHPAQSNMYAVPEPLRSQSVADVIKVRGELPEGYQPANYQEWIEYAFGKTFADNLPKVYTQKYWTTDPANLTTDWIGKRVYFPEISDMVDSAAAPLQKDTHYISSVRYPRQGGFYSYIKNVEASIDISYNKRLTYISFEKKELTFEDGSIIGYNKLINTLPIPMLVLNSDAPENIKASAQKLKCSQVLIINAVVNHPPVIDNHWIYVYDNDFYSTRINFTDLLAPDNGVAGKCGIQVEVYFSNYHPLNTSVDDIVNKVVFKELVEMGLIKSAADVESYHHKWIEWANVIFDTPRVEAQNDVLAWLETKGLVREKDDLEPMTDWDGKKKTDLGDIILAGRFAQWKYYWTDDCVMRGKYIADCVQKQLS